MKKGPHVSQTRNRTGAQLIELKTGVAPTQILCKSCEERTHNDEDLAAEICKLSCDSLYLDGWMRMFMDDMDGF